MARGLRPLKARGGMSDTARDARTRAFLDVATWLAGPLGFSDDVLGAFLRWAWEHGDLPGGEDEA